VGSGVGLGLVCGGSCGGVKMLVLVIGIGSIGFVILKAGLSIAQSVHLGFRPCGSLGVFVDWKLLEGCGGIIVIIISSVALSSDVIAIIVDHVVREVGLLAGLLVEIGRPVVWGLILSLTGAGCAFGSGFGWLLVLVVMLNVLSSLLWRGN